MDGKTTWYGEGSFLDHNYTAGTTCTVLGVLCENANPVVSA